MTFRDLLGSALAGLSQQKLRTSLTLAGVTLGAMLLFCSISGGLGMLNALTERLSVSGRLLTIRISSGLTNPPDDFADTFRDQIPESVSAERRDRIAQGMALRSGKGRTPVPVTLAVLDSVREIDGVDQVTPVLSWNSGVVANGIKGNARLKGIRSGNASIADLLVLGKKLSGDSANEVLVSEDFLFASGFRSDAAFADLIGTPLVLVERNRRARLSEGQLAVLRSSLALRERFLSDDAAEMPEEQLALVRREVAAIKGQLAAQDETVAEPTRSQELTIVGIYKSPDAKESQYVPALTDALRHQLLIPVETASQLRVQSGAAGQPIVAMVEAWDAESVPQVLERLRGRSYQCESLADIAQRIRTAVLMVSALVTAIAGGAFLIAALGMANTMIMNVLERRREIGILKSLGARDRDVLWMFLTEGLLVGAIGGVIGLLLGWLATHLGGDYIRAFVEQRLNAPLDSALFLYPMWLVVGTPIVAGAVTVVASILPARRAARLDPVQTLRAQ